jgi:hypothetical protein
MPVTNKTSELAMIIVNEFEKFRLQWEATDPDLGKRKFIIGTSAPNIIVIQVPKEAQEGDYTDRIYSLVDSIIDEAGYVVTEPIEIYIYGPNQAPIDGRVLYPKSKKHVN